MVPEAIVLVHAGIADNTMWDALEPLLPAGVPVRRHELRGFGSTSEPEGPFSHADDLEAILDRPVLLIGASFGGLVALSVAARTPALVSALVLMDAPAPDWEFGEQVRGYWAAEEQLIEAGDLAGAADLTVGFWVGEASPAVRDQVREMTLRAFELQVGKDDNGVELPEISVAEMRVPALLMVGSRDVEDFRRCAEWLARELPDARHVVIEGAAHLPAMERPAETASAIEEFLAAI